MSVMACDRKGCDSCMCDTLVMDHYICWNCKEDFKEFMDGKEVKIGEMQAAFLEFMRLPAAISCSNEIMDADTFLRSHFLESCR